jgi:signal transduction histidine kinase
MLDALERSMTAQRQLVADASHELRTPVTSLRTNLEVLQANPDLDGERRAELLARATAQTEELTVLMNDLIDLARGDAAEPAREPVRLDELVEEAVERAARHAPASASPWTSRRRPSWARRHGWPGPSTTCSTTPCGSTRRAPRSRSGCMTAS